MHIRQRVIDTWLRDIRAQWGERAYRALCELTPEITNYDGGGLTAAGAELARQGHRLDEVLEWCRLLALRSRGFRSILAEGGVVAIAQGWTDGVLRDEFGATAVTPLDVLRLRMQQQFELSTSVGEAPDRALALVVVDTAGHHDCMPRVADHVRSVFAAGETMATAPNGNLLVLVNRTAEVRVRTLQLLKALRCDEQLRGTPLRVWIEPLANAAEHVDSHLLSLAS